MAGKSILLISSNSSARGGGEKYLVYLATGLRETGCDVHALLSRDEFMDGWASELEAAGATVHRLPLNCLSKRPLRFVQSVFDSGQHRRIAEFCRRLRPQGILVNQQYDEDGLDFIQGALDARVCPVAGIIHMPMTATKNARPLGRARGFVLRKWYHSHPYRILFSSTGSEREFLDYYRPPLRTSVMPSGAPLRKEKTDRQTALDSLNDPWFAGGGGQTGTGLPVIGAVCQFVPQKNLRVLIDGWQWAASNGFPSRLLLIGDGPQRKEIEERLAPAGRGLWHITGWGDRYAQYMSQLDVFLMPSLFESLPLAFVEAVGMGIPAIVSDFNGAADVAARADWVKIVKPLSAKTLGMAITDELRNPRAPVPEAERQRFLAFFSPARMASDLLRFFE